jgi:hypothetical protein
MSLAEHAPRASWGLIGFCFGVFALLAAAMLTSGLMSPAPEPEQSIGTAIGEIARDIRAAATGVTTHVPDAPRAESFDMIPVLLIVTPILAAIAALLGGISLFRHEPATLPKMAIAMGVGAIVMQYAFWLALVICATLLLISIVSNMDGIFGS